MESELFGMIEIDITDHQFAEYLKFQDVNWSCDVIEEYNRFICNGKVTALVKYKNGYPCSRRIWIDLDTFDGYIHDSVRFKRRK